MHSGLIELCAVEQYVVRPTTAQSCQVQLGSVRRRGSIKSSLLFFYSILGELALGLDEC